ncbi:MAG: guanylate kinase [Deltaproteobacteria bacterium]|nr:guanylate kinase [Deltaproteobacteria bacterium]
MSEGHLFIIAAPSGTGKTTLCHMILDQIKNTASSISYTTRKPRSGEKDKVHYYFISHKEFEELKRKSFFAEWAEVYGKLYGTSKKFIQEELKKGNDVILDIDTQGEKQLKKVFGPKVVSIFLLPPSEKELKKRLEGRGTESKKSIEKRFSWSKHEIEESQRFDYKIINDDLSLAFEKIKKIIYEYRK